MKVVSFLKRFFLGAEVLEKIRSPINGEIIVSEDLFGRREMVIGRVAQSGGLAGRLWKSAIKDFFDTKYKKQNTLILGLGCGSVAKIMAAKFPKSQITGIEIDPMVLEMGKKYFGLGEIPNLKIMVGDAINLVQSTKCRAQSFDLIIVDLYLGQEFPKEAESEDFLRRLGSLAAKDGLILFNRLYYNRQHRKMTNQLVKKLRTIFPQIETKKRYTNLLILASF